MYISKRFGCKTMFLHFVKVGMKNMSIPALLQQWRLCKTTKEYQDLLKGDVAKSAYEKELKGKRDRLLSELEASSRLRRELKSQIKRLQREVAHAKDCGCIFDFT